MVAKEVLQVGQADAGFYAMRGITVAQAVRRYSFFKPQLSQAARKAR